MDSLSRLVKIRSEKDSLDQHFNCYLNNKMMILLTLIEHPELHKASELAKRERVSVQDLYHHFLPTQTDPHHRHAFHWLEIFLERYPDISPEHRKKGYEMLRLIGETFKQKPIKIDLKKV